MGKAPYNFGKTAKEKARQQKQMEKASKRQIAKQSKAAVKSGVPADPADATESDEAAALVDRET
ncbi:MAG: hypothetical protein R6W75_09950 [Smithellaceae bacterium]